VRGRTCARRGRGGKMPSQPRQRSMSSCCMAKEAPSTAATPFPPLCCTNQPCMPLARMLHAEAECPPPHDPFTILVHTKCPSPYFAREAVGTLRTWSLRRSPPAPPAHTHTWRHVQGAEALGKPSFDEAISRIRHPTITTVLWAWSMEHDTHCKVGHQGPTKP